MRIIAIGLLVSILIFQFSLGANSPSKSSLFPRALKMRAVPIKPQSVTLSPQANIARVIVKFREGSDVRMRGNALTAKAGQATQVKEAESILSPYLNGKLNRLFSIPEGELDRDKIAYEAASGVQLADMNLYYKIDVRDNGTVEFIFTEFLP